MAPLRQWGDTYGDGNTEAREVGDDARKGTEKTLVTMREHSLSVLLSEHGFGGRKAQTQAPLSILGVLGAFSSFGCSSLTFRPCCWLP
jgi:hypothetical protein